jgi:hypothetical protein
MDAQCQCGALRAQVDVDARPFTTACHCVQCQRRTGSPFGVIAYFSREAVRIDGEAREFTRGSAVGTTVTNGFCPACGGTVYILLEKNPALIGVPVGAFGDSAFPPPNVSVWGQERHHWLELPDSIRQFVQGRDGQV